MCNGVGKTQHTFSGFTAVCAILRVQGFGQVFDERLLDTGPAFAVGARAETGMRGAYRADFLGTQAFAPLEAARSAGRPGRFIIVRLGFALLALPPTALAEKSSAKSFWFSH